MRNRQQKRLLLLSGFLGVIAVAIAGSLIYYTLTETGDVPWVTSPPQGQLSERELQAASSEEVVTEDMSASGDTLSTLPGAESASEGTASALLDTTDGSESTASTAVESAASPESDAVDGLSAQGAAENGTSVAEGVISAENTVSAAESTTPADEPFDVKTELLRSKNDSAFWEGCPTRDIELLTPNPYSRPQEALESVDTLVIHYVANAGSTAMQNRDYFESLKSGESRSASAHFIIGLDGEIVQCIPLSEIAYAVVRHNYNTISIECCHPTDEGWFNDYTRWSLVELASWLCMRFHIDPQTIVRHYDLTGKDCPHYYVEHPEEWQSLKDSIEARYYERIAAEP